MKIALLGDPHATIADKEEIGLIVDYLISLKKQGKVDQLCILGDLFHNHALMRIEVWYFWEEQYKKLQAAFGDGGVDTISGNHDIPGNKESQHLSSLGTLAKQFPNLNFVYEKPFKRSGVLYVPYQFDEESFIKICIDNSDCHTVICHQTFNGAKYDNGMFAPDGFDSTKIPQKNVISGHIHTNMEFANVFYPGIARWTSATDANQQKGIWTIEFNGENYTKDFYSTENVVTPMKTIDITEGDELVGLSDDAKWLVHLIGSSTWVTKTKKKFVGKKIKTTYTDTAKRRSDRKKIDNFDDFLKEFESSVEKRDILELLGKL